MAAPGRVARALIFIAALAFAGLATADEGLWTFERVPKELIAARRGVTLDDAWLKRVQLASVRLAGGCSATFVSPRGLMITSRACAEACLAEYSGGGSSLANDGFSSRGPADEKRCRRARAQVLVTTEEVTGPVMVATSGLDAAPAAAARARELARLEQQCKEASRADPKAEPLDCEAVALFGGGEYRLYKYRSYDDVRLAFAPERAVSSFAGGALEFPRLAFDVAFLRAYVDGKPADSHEFVRVNFAGPAEREPLFVAGHPAATERSTTMAEILTVRDTVLLGALLEATELKGRYAQFALSGAPAREHIAQPLAQLEREIRIDEARFDALLGEPQLATKRAAEESLQQRVAQDPEVKLTAASAFDEIAAAQQVLRVSAVSRMLLDNVGRRCQLCSYARLLVRAAAERQKPDAERRPGFRTAELPRVERELASTEPVAIDVEMLTLGFTLERLRERLGATDPLVARLFARETPMALAERAISRTRLLDPANRSSLWSAGAGAIVSSDDPLIVLMRELEAATDTVDAGWRQAVDAPMRRANERLARARLKFGDSSSYSDATGTLRLSSGILLGWSSNGVAIAPITTLGQMFEPAAAGSTRRLPARWLEAKDRVNAAVGLDVAIDNDIGSACQGCAVLSATGDIVGVVFDGNRRSAAGRYWFDASQGRAVALDTAALKEILLKVYRAEDLMKEIVIAH